MYITLLTKKLQIVELGIFRKIKFNFLTVVLDLKIKTSSSKFQNLTKVSKNR